VSSWFLGTWSPFFFFLFPVFGAHGLFLCMVGSSAGSLFSGGMGLFHPPTTNGAKGVLYVFMHLFFFSVPPGVPTSKITIVSVTMILQVPPGLRCVYPTKVFKFSVCYVCVASLSFNPHGIVSMVLTCFGSNPHLEIPCCLWALIPCSPNPYRLCLPLPD